MSFKPLALQSDMQGKNKKMECMECINATLCCELSYQHEVLDMTSNHDNTTQKYCNDNMTIFKA